VIVVDQYLLYLLCSTMTWTMARSVVYKRDVRHMSGLSGSSLWLVNLVWVWLSLFFYTFCILLYLLNILVCCVLLGHHNDKWEMHNCLISIDHSHESISVMSIDSVRSNASNVPVSHVVEERDRQPRPLSYLESTPAGPSHTE